MTDRLDFEARLQSRLVAHTADVVRPFDAAAISASAAAAGAPRRTWGFRAPWRSSGIGLTPLVAALLLLGLLIALLGALLLSGSRPKFPAVVAPTASATPSPVATPGPVAVAVTPGPSVPPPSFPATSSKPVPGQGVMTRVADMIESRIEPVIVTLTDGRVLIASGGASAEVLDPSTGRFVTVPEPGSVTGDGAGVLLRDGRVLVVLYSGNNLASSIHVFDPRTATWTRIAAKGYVGTELDGGSGSIRRYPTLTLLHDGRVLLSGGEVNSPGGGTGTVVDTAEIFDPVTETIAPTGSLGKPRTGHSATTLPDGRVLVAGGQGLCDTVRDAFRGCSLPALQDAEIYDPATGTFTPTGGMSAVQGRTAGLLLPDGRVLVLPMSTPHPNWASNGGDDSGVVETYDPSSGTFTEAATTPHRARTATLLQDGRIFLTAQWDLPTPADGRPVPFKTWSGVLDPTTGLTKDAPAPPAGWQQPALLTDGRILLVGGVVNAVTPDGAGDSQAVAWAELYKWR